MNKRSKHVVVALLAVIIFIVSGAFVVPALFPKAVNIYEKISVLNEIIFIVNENYVETPDWDNIMDGAFHGLLEKLDPHSAYIPREHFEPINERFQGKFEGIGIEFDILGGYITVISPIVGSPSDRAGLQPGDQIVKINGEDAFKITNQEVYNKLRGPKGTAVDITLRRPGMKETFEVHIIRDQIPIYSVTSAFMLDEKTGYIDLNRFSSSTSQEVREAVDRLVSEGMTQLVFDLRINSGGFLQQAVNVADYFITTRDTIVYTDGRKGDSKEVYLANPNVGYGDFAIIVLVNRWSASASEIVAGAIQDLDRGLIVGETSFGKGLVQRQWILKDDSALRVTIARYYTPSGRLIQRPYENGAHLYYQELSNIDREARLDSLKEKRPKYTTRSGRLVYGGGGITPDIYISNPQQSEAVLKITRHPERLTFNWATEFASSRRGMWNSMEEFRQNFKLSDDILEEFILYLKDREADFEEQELDRGVDYDNLKRELTAQIAAAFWGREAYYQMDRAGDPQVMESVSYFDRAKDFLVRQ